MKKLTFLLIVSVFTFTGCIFVSSNKNPCKDIESTAEVQQNDKDDCKAEKTAKTQPKPKSAARRPAGRRGTPQQTAKKPSAENLIIKSYSADMQADVLADTVYSIFPEEFDFYRSGSGHGSKISMKAYGGTLVVRTTPQLHAEIQKTIDQFPKRHARKMVLKSYSCKNLGIDAKSLANTIYPIFSEDIESREFKASTVGQTLIVRTTPEVHDQIEKIIEILPKAENQN